MELLLITFLLISLTMLLLSLGIMLGRKPIRSTCAGLKNAAQGNGQCENCTCDFK